MPPLCHLSRRNNHITLGTIAGKESAHVKDTDKHDAEATRYLSYALYPLVIGYAIYSLVYKKHKSWYSWVLSSLVGAVYMFGFILMCPQASCSVVSGILLVFSALVRAV